MFIYAFCYCLLLSRLKLYLWYWYLERMKECAFYSKFPLPNSQPSWFTWRMLWGIMFTFNDFLCCSGATCVSERHLQTTCKLFPYFDLCTFVMTKEHKPLTRPLHMFASGTFWWNLRAWAYTMVSWLHWSKTFQQKELVTQALWCLEK